MILLWKNTNVPRIAKKITLTEKQKDVLKQIITSRTHRADHIVRAQMVLLSTTSKSNAQISQELLVSLSTVKKWRNRWLKNETRLLLIDERENGITYVRKILDILSDDQRPGAPCKFTAEQVCQIMSVACERPEDSNLPISHWSLSSLAEEVIKRGIVHCLSRSRLAVFLKSGGYKTT